MTEGVWWSSSPLQKYSLSSLKMVGTLTKPNGILFLFKVKKYTYILYIFCIFLYLRMLLH